MRYRDVSLIAVGKFVYISDERFKVLHEPHSNEWFLVIKSVSYKDQGVYECQVNSDPPSTFKYRLRVLGELHLIPTCFEISKKNPLCVKQQCSRALRLPPINSTIALVTLHVLTRCMQSPVINLFSILEHRGVCLF